MLQISRSTIHHISITLFFFFDEQVFLRCRAHNSSQPFAQLENYSAHKILYTSASSITVETGFRNSSKSAATVAFDLFMCRC